MPTAQFKIECEHPKIVLQAVDFREKDNVKYGMEDNKIILDFECDTVRNLVKATYSVCNKIQLSIDTIKRFNK